jgi:hypothetical protein
LNTTEETSQDTTGQVIFFQEKAAGCVQARIVYVTSFYQEPPDMRLVAPDEKTRKQTGTFLAHQIN